MMCVPMLFFHPAVLKGHYSRSNPLRGVVTVQSTKCHPGDFPTASFDLQGLQQPLTASFLTFCRHFNDWEIYSTGLIN